MDSKPTPNDDFLDVSSGHSSTAPVPESQADGIPEKTHTVVAGDSLSKIAKQTYGDGNRWREIFDANKDQITDPDKIHPGQVLRLP
ncbi:MAG: LysM peptidoglycan-binding domain-containing protein [Gemmatimonadales bacterium]